MPKLLFVVNNPDFFVSHRLEIGRAAVAEGYEVHLAAPAGDGIQQIEQVGIHTHSIEVDQTDHGWLAQFRFMASVLSICRQMRPDICHMITLKTFLVAGFATRLARVPYCIGSISGLGYLFISDALKTRVFRACLRPFFRWVMAGDNIRVIFQNDTDKALMKSYVGIREVNTVMIRGSGVDLDKYPYFPEPEGVPRVVLASRLLKDKGVMEYLEAARQLKQQGMEAVFVLAGEPDPVNPASASMREIQPYVDDGTVEWIGHSHDIAGLFASSHIVVLPSYREGFPKVLIEAAACGRAIVTTDVPGCRDAVENGDIGLLVPMKTVQPLADAIKQLLIDSDKRREMGIKARVISEKKYAVGQVVRRHLELYTGEDNVA